MDHRLKWKTQNYKTLENDIGKNIGEPGVYGTDFLDTTSNAKVTEEIMCKLDLIKIKYFCFEKNDVKIMRKKPHIGRKYLQKYIW